MELSCISDGDKYAHSCQDKLGTTFINAIHRIAFKMVQSSC